MIRTQRILSYIARNTKHTEKDLLAQLSTTKTSIDKSKLYLELGKLKHREQNFSEAVSFYDQGLNALQSSASRDITFMKSTLLHGQAAVFLDENRDLPYALEKAEGSLEIRKILLGSKHAAVAETLTTIGGILLRQNHVTRATECFEQALNGFLEHTKGKEDDPYVTLAFFNLGTAYLRKEEMRKHGVAAIKKSLQLAELLWGVGHAQTERIRTLCDGLETH
jgi:tetratricopeptide (TPR) repeat protein